MNNWEVFRRRLEGDADVTRSLDNVAVAARAMASAARAGDFPAMGTALRDEWSARRQLAPVVSSPAIERAIAAARDAGAWGGKACGAGEAGASCSSRRRIERPRCGRLWPGSGKGRCSTFARSPAVSKSSSSKFSRAPTSPVGEPEEDQHQNGDDESRHAHEPGARDRPRPPRFQAGQRRDNSNDDREAQPEERAHRVFIHATHRSSSSRIAAGDAAWCFQPWPGAPSNRKSRSFSMERICSSHENQHARRGTR